MELSWMKTFSILFLIFFSTINVKPSKESLNCWILIVGKKELKLFWLIIERDLFKAKGVIKVEKKNI